MSDRPDLLRHYGGDGFLERLDDALARPRRQAALTD
jgi:hypothetical protein